MGCLLRWCPLVVPGRGCMQHSGRKGRVQTKPSGREVRRQFNFSGPEVPANQGEVERVREQVLLRKAS